jgi:hypothetical protein
MIPCFRIEQVIGCKLLNPLGDRLPKRPGQAGIGRKSLFFSLISGKLDGRLRRNVETPPPQIRRNPLPSPDYVAARQAACGAPIQLRAGLYCACAFAAAISASLRTVSTAILLERA